MRSKRWRYLGFLGLTTAIFFGDSHSPTYGASIQTPWTGADISSSWFPGKTYHMIEHIEPTRSGTRPEPPVTAVIASGHCRLSHVKIKLWKPGKSNYLLVQYDYVPLDKTKTHPSIIDLVTKSGQIAAVFTYRSPLYSIWRNK